MEGRGGPPIIPPSRAMTARGVSEKVNRAAIVRAERGETALRSRKYRGFVRGGDLMMPCLTRWAVERASRGGTIERM